MILSFLPKLFLNGYPDILQRIQQLCKGSKKICIDQTKPITQALNVIESICFYHKVQTSGGVVTYVLSGAEREACAKRE